MIAFLQVSTSATLGYLCVAAGFLIIVASVVFVVKGKAVLGETGAPNTVEWGKIKANLTSAVSLFVLGAGMIALPFWRFQTEEGQMQMEKLRQPATALLKGKIVGPESKDVRLLLVVKPDYDQTYRDVIEWQFPLLATRTSYSVFYVADGAILGQQPFTVEGPAPQTITLPEFVLRLPQDSSVAQHITPKLEVSNAELKSLGIR